MRFRTTITCLVTTGIIFGAGLIQAEEPTETTEEPAGTTLGTITVTAQKKEENAQEVPISMTVFDEFTIEDIKIESVQNVFSYTPNLNLEDRGAGYYVPSIRGISNPNAALNQSTSVIIDGIPVTRSQGFNVSLINIERIEVLKGPQGTLYGNGAQAGVINIITKQPDNERRGKIGVELGEDNKRQYDFNASGAIVKDKFYIGLSARHYEKDGFIENTLLGGYTNDRENDYGRLNLRYTPTDKLEVSIISSISIVDDGNLDYLSSDTKSMSTETQGYDNTDSMSHALKISYDLNNYLIESISTYRNVDWDQLQDYDNYDYAIINDYDKYSQELRLSNSSDVFKWLLGFYVDKDEVDDASHMIGATVSPSITEGDSLGLFMHTDYAINDKFSFISGIRYDKDNIEYEESDIRYDFSDSEISPKVSLKYEHDKNSMYYATISKGYLSGGYNTLDGSPPEYDSETLWNYEIGAKNTFFNNRLVVNSAIFYMQIDDMQVRVFPDPNSHQRYIDNAAEATSKGFEIGLNGRITDTITLFGGFGYTDATMDEYNDGKADYSGNKTVFAPEYNYNVGVQYRSKQGYFATIDLNGYGKAYFDNANENSRDPYTLVNAKIGYEADNYDVYIYGRNIFDEEYDSIGAFGGSGILYSPPSEFGIQLAYRF